MDTCPHEGGTVGLPRARWGLPGSGTPPCLQEGPPAPSLGMFPLTLAPWIPRIQLCSALFSRCLLSTYRVLVLFSALPPLLHWGDGVRSKQNFDGMAGSRTVGANTSLALTVHQALFSALYEF